MRQSGVAARTATRSTQAPSVLSTKPRQKTTWPCPSDAPAWPAVKPSGVRIGSRTVATRSRPGSSGGRGYGANGTTLRLASPAPKRRRETDPRQDHASAPERRPRGGVQGPVRRTAPTANEGSRRHLNTMVIDRLGAPDHQLPRRSPAAPQPPALTVQITQFRMPTRCPGGARDRRLFARLPVGSMLEICAPWCPGWLGGWGREQMPRLWPGAVIVLAVEPAWPG